MKPLSNLKPGLPPKPGQNAAVRPALQRQPTAEERRRAQRVLLRMAVQVHLKDKPEPIKGFTHTVSATGAMIILPEGMPAGSKFILENCKTQERVEVHVVRPSQLNQEGSLVPVEFLSPAPKFWNIFFPPNVN
ncbi:MAG TPA: PilZ domain-containing protein [Candidatus Angelobacter sp.]|nr:PilZ domain-containing protein [Candidatus Angelobacter sp.]